MIRDPISNSFPVMSAAKRYNVPLDIADSVSWGFILECRGRADELGVWEVRAFERLYREVHSVDATAFLVTIMAFLTDSGVIGRD